MLATNRDETWNVINMQHITPNSKRRDALAFLRWWPPPTMIIQTSLAVAIKRLKDSPTWLNVATTSKSPNLHPRVRLEFENNNNMLLPWWRHQMETFSALLAICAGNSPVSGDFLVQRQVTRSFDAFLDLLPNKRLSKQSRGWWFETQSRPSWRHCNATNALWWSSGDQNIKYAVKSLSCFELQCQIRSGWSIVNDDIIQAKNMKILCLGRFNSSMLNFVAAYGWWMKKRFIRYCNLTRNTPITLTLRVCSVYRHLDKSDFIVVTEVVFWWTIVIR